MAEIKVKASEIENAIRRLNFIVIKEIASMTSPPTIIGGGQAINELEEIAEVCRDLDSNLITLAKNTISFLDNVKNSFTSSDQKAGNKMGGG